jgi:hypothetical protein
MKHALKNGILFTRYLPDLAFGYGYPFFNYREPVSYYLSLALFLTGLPLPWVLNLIYVLTILASGLAAYLLGRDMFGRSAGLVAAVAYAYAPYQFLNALTRGNAPESAALPLFPFILWAFRRLALTGRRRYVALGTASLAILYLTHNISSLIFTPVLLGYLAVLWCVHRREGHWVATAVALILAVGLTAFFWGPALLEQDYVQLHMSRVTRNNDYHYNFLGLLEIFAPPGGVDTSLMNPPMEVNLGLSLSILGCAGLAVGLFRSSNREQRSMSGFLALWAVVMVWMSTSVSLPLWERLPLISFVQFPWRFVGRATLPVALLAGAVFVQPTRDRSGAPATRGSRMGPICRQIALFVVFAGLVLPSLPLTYPPAGYCPAAPYPTITDVFTYEHTTKLVGVDPEGSYFPVWVERRPDGSPLEDQYAGGGPVRRFDPAVMPRGAHILDQRYGANRASITVETPESFRARYLAFYFPGWQVRIDGKAIPVAPSGPDGLIGFEVPSGRHTITIRFTETPLRLVADLVSVLTLVGLPLVLWWLGRHSAKRPATDLRPGRSPHSLALPLGLVLALLLLGLKLGLLDRTDTVFRGPSMRPEKPPLAVERMVNRLYEDGMRLIGYNQDQSTMPADGTLRVDLFWTVDTQPTASYQSVLHLVGPDGLRWSLPDSFRPRGYAKYPATTSWDPTRYALDSHEIEALPGTPPGTYDIVVIVFDRATLAPLSVMDAYGQPVAPELQLGQITLTHPRRAPTVPAGSTLDIAAGDFSLLTADFDHEQAAPGDTMLTTLMWQVNADGAYAPEAACSLDLLPAAVDRPAAKSYPLPPPVPQWAVGEIWRSQHRITLPVTLEGGLYTWAVGKCTLEPAPIGQIEIAAPSRAFTEPPAKHTVDVTLGELATLVGFSLDGPPLWPGDSLSVTLVWKAERTAETSFHVFLHLLDTEGHIVIQSDSVPARWSRPTTGWLPGEYILDSHELTLPPDINPGRYSLSVGLYVPGGERLLDPTGQDTITLTVLPIPAD